jgi:hypothetical protein
MGQLKPDTTYIYEKANGVTYAREFGAPSEERFEIGREYPPREDTFMDLPVSQLAVLVELVQAAKTNPALQDALDRAKVIYELSRQDSEEYKPMWHPV